MKTLQAKLTLTALVSGIALGIVGWGSSALLGAFGLTYRHWIFSTWLIALLALIFTFLGGLVACLLLYEDKYAILIRTIGTLALLAVMIWMLFISLLLLAFGVISTEEQVVERDGRKLVCLTERNLLHVFVSYYDYKNWFVRGTMPTKETSEGRNNDFILPTPVSRNHYQDDEEYR